MDFATFYQQFHFLRPGWLLLLAPAAYLVWSIHSQMNPLRTWKKIINPALLKHLLLDDSGQPGRWQPVYMLGIAWLTAILALAGPSWKMQPSPFSEDQAAMFIVIKVTPGMLAQDVQPSRLQRAVLKIQDLLEMRSDIRTGLIAYAGSAHLVMPLTSDSGVISTFAAALEPQVMPRQGDEPAEAIALAGQRLNEAEVPGSIVLITDEVDELHLEALQATHQQFDIDVHILAMAAGPEVIPPPGSYPAPPLDIEALNKAASVMRGTVTVVTPDKQDVESLARLIERSISRLPAKEGQQWVDSGYYLLVVLVFIMLTFFRRGGSVAV